MEREQRRLLEHLFPTHPGSIAELLENVFQTRVRAHALFHLIISAHEVPYPITDLALEGPDEEEPVIFRRVVLLSERTGERMVFAEVCLVPRRTPRSVQWFLRETQSPLGRILKDLALSTRRRSLSCERIDDDGIILQALGISSACRLLRRSSCMWLDTDGPPAMLITEWLPLLSEAAGESS